MAKFSATIEQFEKMGEKTGWNYIRISAAIAQQLVPGNKKGFRVKGKLDNYSIKGVSLLPMGGGDFIMPINAEMRKGTGKRKGATLTVQITVDKEPYKLNEELLDCLADEPKALEYFNSLTPSHRSYWSKWIDSAKTDATKTKRITESVKALVKKFDYGQMIRSLKQNREDQGV